MSLTHPEVLVAGTLQGISGLFPMSGLRHSVPLPALMGGRWAKDLDVSAPQAPQDAANIGAGARKLPDLFGSLGDGVRGQVLAGSVASFVAAYAPVCRLMRWFPTRTLVPFAVCNPAAGDPSLVGLAVR